MKTFLVFMILLSCIPNLAFGKLSNCLSENKLDKFSADELVPFDIYFNGESEETVKMHLDNFAYSLKTRSDEIGYVISYAGKCAEKNESASNIEKIKTYLTKKKKINIDHLVFLDGGFRDKGLTELFIVPKDSIKPAPSPTIDSKDLKTMECECSKEQELILLASNI